MINHTSECMLSEVDWGAHETHPNGHSITEVDWGGHDPSLYLMDGCILFDVDWGAHGSSPNQMNGFLLSEVDWGAHDSSFFLYLMHIDHDAKSKGFLTQGLWGGLPERTCSTPLMEYLKDLLMLDKLKMDFSTPNQSRDIEVHTLFLTLNSMKVATTYFLDGILGRILCNLHSSGRKAQVSSLPKQRGVPEFSQQNWVYPIPSGAIRIPSGAIRNPNLNVTLKAYPRKFWH